MSDSKGSKDYDDLKAKLGLKRPERPSATATGSALEPAARPAAERLPGETTPPGGFDLGLHRGQKAQLQTDDEIERAADARAATAGGEFVLRQGAATRVAKLVLIGLLLIASGAVGFYGSRTMMAHQIVRREKRDAFRINKKFRDALVRNGDVRLKKAVTEFVKTVQTLHKKLPAGRDLTKLTPDEAKKAKPELIAIHKACEDYVAHGALLDAKSILPTEIFNAAAVKPLMNLDEVLAKLHFAAMAMANEGTVFGALAEEFTVPKAEVPDVVRTWEMWPWMKGDDKEPAKGFLRPVELETEKDGKVKYLPPEAPLPKDAPPEAVEKRRKEFADEWRVRLKYVKPQKEEEGKWFTVAARFVTNVNLKNVVEPYAQATVEKVVTQDRDKYGVLLLLRLMGRVDEVVSTAEPVLKVYDRTEKDLAALVDQASEAGDSVK